MSLSYYVQAVIQAFLLLIGYITYKLLIAPRYNPLHKIAGPPVKGFSGATILTRIGNTAISPRAHQVYVQRYGRSMRIRGLGPWDERLLTLDPLSLQHVLKHITIYEKPWQSQQLITSLIGCGMLSAEGQVHKRQRRVATPAFSLQNLRALVPLVFNKGSQLKDKWAEMMQEEKGESPSLTLDVCHWISRATFDVMGVAGFDYDFNAIQEETNELLLAYKEMFEVSVSQPGTVRAFMLIFAPWFHRIFPDHIQRTLNRCQGVIRRVAGHLIQEKKRKIEEAASQGKLCEDRDLLSLLLKSNLSTDITPENRISDEDILHNINTFMFAGSDTSSLSLSWTLHLLAENPAIQTRLRNELISITTTNDVSGLTGEEIHSLYDTISSLPFLHNVVRESLRLIPPVHSSIRVATQDDEIPTLYPVHRRDKTIDEGKRSVTIAKGSLVHIAIEGFNLDKEVWGEDAWEFNPDRWDALPDRVQDQPGVFSNIMTFSAGPRSCIGVRFSLIEIKSFLYILLTHFVFLPTGDKIRKNNVVLTRPYISGRIEEGSKLPMIIRPYRSEEALAHN